MLIELPGDPDKVQKIKDYLDRQGIHYERGR
ncbi:MAG: hypothetical protein UH654_02490 [Lachnospiraceae bacterium]|nr:hypothetical protein [Lachnospiraceae bacterium]